MYICFIYICSPGPSYQLWWTLEKAGYESFKIHAIKLLLVEMFEIFTGSSPEYLSDIFEKSDNPYCMWDKHKLVQPLKQTTTYGLRSFEYYGWHVWNILLCPSKLLSAFQNSKNRVEHWSDRNVHSLYVWLCSDLWYLWYTFMHMNKFYCWCEKARNRCI